MGLGKLGPLKLADLQPGAQLPISFTAFLRLPGQVAMSVRLACTDCKVGCPGPTRIYASCLLHGALPVTASGPLGSAEQTGDPEGIDEALQARTLPSNGLHVQGLPVGCSVGLEVMVERPFSLQCRLGGAPRSQALLAPRGPLPQLSLSTQQVLRSSTSSNTKLAQAYSAGSCMVCQCDMNVCVPPVWSSV